MMPLARWLQALGLLVAALLLATRAVDAQEAHTSLRAFYPTGEYDLVVGETKVDAEIYFSRRAAAYLVAPASDERMYLLMQKSRSVATVSVAPIRRENGDVDLPASVEPSATGRLDLKAGEIWIQAPTLRGRLRPRPALLGYHDANGVLRHSPQYGLVMRAYAPNEDAIKRLEGVTGVKVEVIFGSWCPRCQQTVGNALRVDRALDAKGIAFTYYGLAAPPDAWKDARFLATQAKALPTAMVFVDDKLAGRIPPADWTRFDVALARIVRP